MSSPADLETHDDFSSALLALGRLLRDEGYSFITTTPATHRRVLGRPGAARDILRDSFGWNRPLDPDALPAPYQSFIGDPRLFGPSPNGRVRARVRFSTFHELLLAHSGFPTTEPDSVFFGPDTYRFGGAIAALRESEPHFRPRRVIDLGAGSGAGGLLATRLFETVSETVLSDINPKAVEFARANAALNKVDGVQCRRSDLFVDIKGHADLIVSNPPYLVDPEKRAYRHGGGLWGDALAVRILSQALDRLTPAGRLMLYTGTPVVQGTDIFLEGVKPLLQARVSTYRYHELDPDVFGEELVHPPYDQADRIATVVLHVSGKDLFR